MSAAWSGDGLRIVTASRDGTARIWDAGSGQELAVLGGHLEPVHQAVWNTEGTRIATASDDGTARIYYVLVEDLVIEACQRSVRNMSDQEWRKYMDEIEYRESCPGKPVPGQDY